MKRLNVVVVMALLLFLNHTICLVKQNIQINILPTLNKIRIQRISLMLGILSLGWAYSSNFLPEFLRISAIWGEIHRCASSSSLPDDAGK